jgi:hypothetical protein
MATIPYTPSAVPQSGDIREIERFLNEELALIASSIATTSVAGAYGGIGMQTNQPLIELDTTPVQLEGWETAYPPVRDNRVDTDIVTGSLITLEAGAYQFSAQVNAIVNAGGTYSLTLYRNGTPTNVTATWDTSNQTGLMWMTINVLIGSNQGDVYTLWVNSSATPPQFEDFIVAESSFQLFRVSEVLKEGL